ncbi:hypothetical protein [Veronia nyctiphanis]|uniref:hypothetical protein n=1 Tax=Veronia nyctiphanis TaxID=1278244 RepID=UPI001F16D7C8|nr:hypothetical protein [Veronia nyctiphanis]
MAASSAITLEEAIGVVARQALDIERYTQEVNMLAIQSCVNIFYSLSDVFENTSLIGILSNNSFAIIGTKDQVRRTADLLDERQIDSLPLPVRHGFHSPQVEPAKLSFQAYCRERIQFHTPKIPVYSSASRNKVKELNSDYLWTVCRSRFNFSGALIKAVTDHPRLPMIDIGPSGAAANHAKHILGASAEVRHGLRSAPSAFSFNADSNHRNESNGGIVVCRSK